MDALPGNVAQRAVDHALALKPRHPGKGGAFDLHREVRFARAIVARVAVVARAVVDHGKVAGGEGLGQQAFHFGGKGSGHVSKLGRRRLFDKRREGTICAAMRATIVHTPRECRIVFERADGSRADTSIPHKGPFPHDAMHYAVEREMGLAQGFWGLVAGGRHPDELAAMAKAAGHASASRAGVPQAHIVELLQAERLVECFEADLWGGPSDGDTLRSVYAAACASSHVPCLPLGDPCIAAIRAEVARLSAAWQGGRLELDWDEANVR